MSRPPASRMGSKMKPPDQPLPLPDATDDEESTEDKVMDGDTAQESKATIAMMIRNTPALTAN
jgi:hypothetical protein